MIESIWQGTQSGGTKRVYANRVVSMFSHPKVGISQVEVLTLLWHTGSGNFTKFR